MKTNVTLYVPQKEYDKIRGSCLTTDQRGTFTCKRILGENDKRRSVILSFDG